MKSNTWFLRIAVILSAVGTAQGSAVDPDTEATPVPLVELHCKIIPEPGDRTRKTWNVQLRVGGGEPLREAVVAGGATVRFKKLPAGIYNLCLKGEKGRQGCQSVDLVPPPGQRSWSFDRSVEAPRSSPNQWDSHTVSAARLTIPQAARSLLKKAEQAQVQGKSGEARRHLEKALEIHPDYPDALNNLGIQYHRAGEHTRAIELFRRATEIDPFLYAAWSNLGGTLRATGNFHGSLEAVRRAQDLRPDEPLVNFQLAMNYYYLRKYQEAKVHFLRAMTLDPAAANAPQLFLAQIAVVEKRFDDARAYIRNYMELHPNSPQAHQLRTTLQNLASDELVESAAVIPQEP